jgi:hypothetical protein
MHHNKKLNKIIRFIFLTLQMQDPVQMRPVASNSLKRNRCDTSLVKLTQEFIALMKNSPDGDIDLKVASVQLNSPKRRLYDITNILEGVEILEKVVKVSIKSNKKYFL